MCIIYSDLTFGGHDLFRVWVDNLFRDWGSAQQTAVNTSDAESDPCLQFALKGQLTLNSQFAFNDHAPARMFG